MRMTVIDEYLQNLPQQQKEALQHVREVVKELVPDAEEVMSYGMPAYRYRTKPLIYFAAFKDHLSLFPTSEPIASLQERLKGFKQSKGTIQFTVEHPIPDDIIRELVAHRMERIEQGK